VIVEEFAVTKYKYSKFMAYLFGGILIAFLAVIEHIGEAEEGEGGDPNRFRLIRYR